MKSDKEWMRLLEEKLQSFFIDSNASGVSRWLEKAENAVKNHGGRYLEIARRDGSVRGKRVLDAGCGDGTVSIRFALAGAKTIGVDIDADFLHIAQLRSEDYNDLLLQFLEGDLCQNISSIAGEQFDIILSVDVLEHVPDPKAYLINLRDHLTNQGKIYLFTENKYSVPNIIADPHYKLPLMVLLPRALAGWVVGDAMRLVKVFDTYHFFGTNALKRLCIECSLVATDLVDDDFDEMVQRRPKLRSLLTLSVLKRVSRFFYNYYHPSIKIVLQRAQVRHS